MKYISLLFIIVFLFTFSTRAFAVDFTVNLTTDQHDADTADGICDVDLATEDEQCSLRAAVEQANRIGSDDRVFFDLPANSIISLTTANGGQISIIFAFSNSETSGTLEIIGTGANNLTIDGGNSSRIFFSRFATVTISGVTLTGGNGKSSMNDSAGAGGAVFAGGSLTLDRVHITGNTAGESGGVFFGDGTHRIVASTFSNNFASGGCGGFLNRGTLTVVNSTISGNSAGTNGGGFCNGSSTSESTNSNSTTLRNVTISNNTANGGGGINQGAGMLDFGNTIVAGNRAISNSGPEIRFTFGAITSAGGNLIGDSAGDSANIGFPINYQSTDILDVNPLLGALQTNGGTTPTHALPSDSPAVNRGLNFLATDPSNGNALLIADQRGSARFSGVRVDIGAVEFASVKSRKRARFF